MSVCSCTYYSIPLLPLCGGLGVDGGEGESSIITDDEGSSANIYKNRKKNFLWMDIQLQLTTKRRWIQSSIIRLSIPYIH